MVEYGTTYEETVGMDMTYFYTELSLNDGGYLVKNTRLLLYKKLKKELEDRFGMSCFGEMGGNECIYTIVENNRRNGETFSWKESPTHCMELYMPVLGGNLDDGA